MHKDFYRQLRDMKRYGVFDIIFSFSCYSNRLINTNNSPKLVINDEKRQIDKV